MLDELKLGHLAEMGIDVYVPRARAAKFVATDSVPAVAASTPVVRAPARSGRTTILILADPGSRWANGVVTGVERALKFARAGYSTTESCQESALSNAAGVVVFGDALARKAGAVVPAPQQHAATWIFAADPAAVARDAAAKRALWSELKRLLRSLNTVR